MIQDRRASLPVPPALTDLEEHGTVACLAALREEFAAAVRGYRQYRGWTDGTVLAVATIQVRDRAASSLVAAEGDLLLVRRDPAPSLVLTPGDEFYAPRGAYALGPGYLQRSGMHPPYRVVETAGQRGAAMVRALLGIRPQTPRWQRPWGADGKGEDRVREVLGLIAESAAGGGGLTARQASAIRALLAPALAWQLHVDLHGAAPVQQAYLNSLTPQEVTELLGQMADAGVANTGEGEHWFRGRRAGDIAAWQAAERSRHARPRAGSRPAGLAAAGASPRPAR